MKFTQWLSKKDPTMIFIDLDDTLLKSKHVSSLTAGELVPKEPGESLRDRMTKIKAMRDQDIAQGFLEQGWRTFEGRSGTYFTKAKPHAQEFIAACRSLGQTYVFTQGVKDHQMLAIEASGLPFSSAEVFGRQEFRQMPQSPRSILIDDLRANTIGTRDKLEALGIGEDRFVHFEMDSDLLLLLPAIKQLVSQGEPDEQEKQPEVALAMNRSEN